MSNIILDSNSFANSLNDIPDSGANKALSNATNLFGFRISNEMFATFGRWITVIDVFLIVMMLVGIIMVMSSLLGNNGEWKRRGVGTIIWIYITLVATRLVPVLGMASSRIGISKGLMFILILVSQLIFIVGTPMVFLMGSEKLMLAEMIDNDQELDKSQGYFHWLSLLFVIGAITYCVTEAIL